MKETLGKLGKKIKNRKEEDEMKALFTVNRYDRDGDLIESCITIHVDRFSMQFQHRDELDEFIKNLQKISNEIATNYEQ